ncbi:MAG: excalibur calcium-binding domain-containing protein [Acinetobacter sp.]|nr:MAG: excalibur calcium-binding domain-containing protein [Acinetobacter sp.]
MKDFPNKTILPKIGEKLTFSIGQDGQKIKAINIVRLEFPNQPEKNHAIPERIVSRSKRTSKQAHESGGLFGTVLVVIIVGVIGYFVYGFIQDFLHRSELANQPVTTETLQIANQQVKSNPNHFKCDGRIHCSQMNSKDEADWFAQNCPGTRMDGDGDGDACESDSRW